MSEYNFEVAVRFSDLDAYNHVNNANYFRYFEDTRLNFFLENNKPLAWIQDNNLHLVIAEQSCKYKVPVLHPNTLIITQKIIKVSTSSIDFEYNVCKKGDNKICTTATAKLVPFDTQKQKIFKIIPKIKQMFLSFQ